MEKSIVGLSKEDFIFKHIPYEIAEDLCELNKDYLLNKTVVGKKDARN